MNIRKTLAGLVVFVLLAVTASMAWAQVTSIYGARMCGRLPTATQRVSCRVCVRTPRMVYDVPSNSCRPFGARR